MISLQDISVTFKTDKNKAVHAVQHVSLEVDKGDVYGIVGY
ncbi:MAG: methionine ABC transporter ATP-binding protein, partial [Trichococcus flocculiformis]